MRVCGVRVRRLAEVKRTIYIIANVCSIYVGAQPAGRASSIKFRIQNKKHLNKGLENINHVLVVRMVLWYAPDIFGQSRKQLPWKPPSSAAYEVLNQSIPATPVGCLFLSLISKEVFQLHKPEFLSGT